MTDQPDPNATSPQRNDSDASQAPPPVPPWQPPAPVDGSPPVPQAPPAAQPHPPSPQVESPPYPPAQPSGQPPNPPTQPSGQPPNPPAQPSGQPAYPPGQPPGQPAYPPGQPSGQPPYAPDAYPQVAVPPAPPAPPARRVLSGGALAAIIGGGILGIVAVSLAIGFAIFSSLGNAAQAELDSGGSVAEGYLTAIAGGDAERALSYVARPPAPGPLLTDEVLAVSNELAPIGDIEVGDVDLDEVSGTVSVAYTRGDESVAVVYDLVKYDRDGPWLIVGGTGSLELSRFSGLDVIVNDQPIDADTVDVLPGTYEFATGLENFELTGRTTVTEPFEFGSTSGIEPTLSETGLTLFRQVVRDAVDQCVASTTLAAGCGLELPAALEDGTVLVDGTVTRILPVETQATLDALDAVVGFDTPTLVQGDFIGSVDVSADCAQDGTSGRCELVFGPSLEGPYVEMSSATPTVRWD